MTCGSIAMFSVIPNRVDTITKEVFCQEAPHSSCGTFLWLEPLNQLFGELENVQGIQGK